ncbi:MAG: ATP-grasp domain-containing protein [Micrococcaceae bacterium]
MKPEQNKGTVLLVDPMSSGENYLKFFAQKGWNCTILDTGKVSHLLKPHLKKQSLNFVQDFNNNLSQLITYLHEHKIDYVISASEPSVPFVEKLRAKAQLHYRNVDSLARARFHKGHMLDALKKANIPMVDFIWGSNPAEFKEFVENFDFSTKSLILKPALGAASIGIHHVKSKEEAQATLEDIFCDEVNYIGKKIKAVVAQEFFQGKEYVLDTYSYDGHHVLSHSNSYQKHPSSQGTFIYDHSSWLAADENIVQQLFNFSVPILESLGIQNGCSHIEYLVNEAGTVQFVELNFRPHGGNNIPFIHHLTGGHCQMWQEVEWITEQKKPKKTYHLAYHGKYIDMSLAEPIVFKHYNTEDVFPSSDPRLWARYARIQTGVKYPETLDLHDTMELDSFCICAAQQSDVDDAEKTIRKNFKRLVAKNR